MADRSKWIALVIGNSKYLFEAEVSGKGDAEEISRCLDRLGVGTIKTVPDGTFEEMNSALDLFEAAMPGAEAVLLFYSGHGFQENGRNFLLPTDGAVGTSKMFAVDDVLQRFASAPRAIKIAFLNACRDNGPTGSAVGFANPGTPPGSVLQAFSASPGQVAASGLPENLSPYAEALIKNILVPGLELGELLENVRRQILKNLDGQQPFIAGAVPTNFFFRDAIKVKAQLPEAPNDSLVVIRNGDIVLNKADTSTGEFDLSPGRNDLTLLVSHGRTYRNGQTWGPTEDWLYQLDLTPSEGATADFNGHFEGKEEVPFKDGPRHGRAFVAAKARIDVDADSVTLAADTDKDFWKHDPDTPIYAQNQETLFESSIVALGLTANDIIGDVTQLGILKDLAGSIIASILQTGELLPGGPKVADPSKTFFIVRGNEALRPIVQTCFTDPDLRAKRILELRASVAAAFNRVPRPFDLFDQGLNTDVRQIGQSQGRNPNDLRVWTAIDDRSHAPVPVTTEAAALESLTDVAPDALRPLPGEILLGPIPADQTVQGVPVAIQVYPFVTFSIAGSQLKVHTRVIADLSDLQNKAGVIVDTIPLPTNTMDHFGLDNVVARIWGKQLAVDGHTATLNLKGDVDVWIYEKDVPCSRVVWDGFVPRFEFFDCRPPINRPGLNQPFEASLPFTVSVADAQSFAVVLGQPSVALGGIFGGVTNGILRIAGVDLNARVKAALDQAVNPAALRQVLPDFVLAFNPVLSRAELMSYSGALALHLEMDGAVEGIDLPKVLAILLGRH